MENKRVSYLPVSSALEAPFSLQDDFVQLRAGSPEGRRFLFVRCLCFRRGRIFFVLSLR